MGTQVTRGFTIIETMLFLAISGLLIVGMLAGTGASINIQRYRDAVETFKTTLQNQYGELSSVKNDRDDNWTCTGTAQSEAGGSEARGQSDCVLMGRYLSVVDSKINISSVLGRENTTTQVASNDIEYITKNYVLNVSTVTDESTILEWGTRIAWPASGTGAKTPTTPRSLAILFLRSPSSGQI